MKKSLKIFLFFYAKKYFTISIQVNKKHNHSYDTQQKTASARIIIHTDAVCL